MERSIADLALKVAEMNQTIAEFANALKWQQFPYYGTAGTPTATITIPQNILFAESNPKKTMPAPRRLLRRRPLADSDKKE